MSTGRRSKPAPVPAVLPKIGNWYVVPARKAIQGYFGPDPTQYAQVGGTRQSDRKTGGRRAMVAAQPQAA